MRVNRHIWDANLLDALETIGEKELMALMTPYLERLKRVKIERKYEISQTFSINLTIDDELTLESVAALISSKDDSKNRQLRVTNDGVAYLSDIVGNIDTDGLSFHFETWCAGNSYCGTSAAQDMDWVKTVYHDLKRGWENPSSIIVEM